MPLVREDQAVIHAAVAGVNPPAVPSGWSSLDGGDVQANNVKVWPGGMLHQQDLGGPATRSDITIKRPYSDSLHQYLVQWENVVGRAAMWVSYTLKDANGNPLSGTVTYTGKLKQVIRPNYDANNNNPAFVTLVMSADLANHISN